MRQAMTGRAWNHRGWGLPAVALTLFCALLAAAFFTSRAEGASADGCRPNCVILIQVDGLEPKDVTQATTPYLWAVAHPRPQGVSLPGALAGRSGWIWQAPRGVMSTGTASATSSLLTGAYPEKSGIPADNFYGPNSQGAFARQRLGAGGFGDSPDPQADGAAEPIGPSTAETLINVASQTTGVATFLGDPGLADLTQASTQAVPYWFPGGATYPESQYASDPRLCPVPRYPDSGAQPPSAGTGNFDASRCPANDLTTATKAFNDLNRPTSSDVGFTFIHLAELGAARRLVADPTVDPPASVPASAPPTPAQALADVDAAIATFVEQYGQAKAATTWAKTVLMVVGSHGYQLTPQANRVPDPRDTNPIHDLSDYVAEFPGAPAKSLELVPQGTSATIYYTGDPTKRAEALAAIKAALDGDTVNTACVSRNPALAQCIQRVSYLDSGTPNTTDTVAARHPTWHLDARDLMSGARTRASGDLIVELGRGWAVGRTAGMSYQGGLPGQPATNTSTASSGGPQERAVAALINGPNQGAQGAVRNLDTFGSAKYYPVSPGPVDPSDHNNPPPVPAPTAWPCPDTTTDPGGLACANTPANVPDDADDPGHEAQPVTVDFALTISALMQLPFESHPDQLQGRVLQEAFVNELSKPCVGNCDPPPPPSCFDVAALTLNTQSVPVSLSCVDLSGAPLTYRIVSGPSHGTLGTVTDGVVTYTPAGGFSGNDTFTYQATSKYGPSDVATATVVVAEPPVIIRPPEFDFYGLVRKLKAFVVDSKDRSYSKAPRGTVLSTIHLEADFGKPESAVTLTFYRRVTSSARGKVVRLRAIARFDPFAVKRGHVTMRLKVPPQFSPNYVGVTVREIARNGARRRLVGGVACTTLKTIKPVPFRCTGPSGGMILPIADAGRLHKPKVGGPAPRRGR